ncbi:MAG: hypothetical protein AAFV59_10165 [Pseudomonadota bacterium]
MAAAAPWVQDEAGFYTQLSFARETVNGFDGQRTKLYGEYGLNGEWTATASIERVEYPDGSDFNTTGWRATLRRPLLRYKSIQWSLEGGALHGAAIGGRNGCEALGGELRTGLGWSANWRNRSAYMFGEIATRQHEGCRRERFEYGFGVETRERIWSITQIWLERGQRNAPSDKFQSEILWRTDLIDVSLGYRKENGGRFEEEAVFMAFARQY